MSRPVRVPLDLSEDLKQRVERLAHVKHRSRNAQLVRLIEVGLAVSTASSPEAAAARVARSGEADSVA